MLSIITNTKIKIMKQIFKLYWQEEYQYNTSRKMWSSHIVLKLLIYFCTEILRYSYSRGQPAPLGLPFCSGYVQHYYIWWMCTFSWLILWELLGVEEAGKTLLIQCSHYSNNLWLYLACTPIVGTNLSCRQCTWCMKASSLTIA